MAEDSSHSDRIIFHRVDVYRNMRLNIDGMSYEELLALEERMGKVCTGVPEAMIPSCLMVKEQQAKQERSCAICLEEYKIKDKLGVLYVCGHEYHVPCIITWLLKKKTCPVCRRAAL